MSTGISALYSEFTAALTEVLAENAVGPARSRPTSQGLVPPLCGRPLRRSLSPRELSLLRGTLRRRVGRQGNPRVT